MVSKEEENFLRIVYLNYRVATGALTRFFDKLHANLSADLHIPGNKAKLKKLLNPTSGRKPVLYQGQWDILYPPPGSAAVTSADLDLTLMVCLLRNIHPVVTAPQNGFDKLPLPHEKSEGASIACLKYYKNFIISHSKDGTLSNVEFGRIMTELEQAVTTLDNSAATTASLKEAKTITLDSGMAKVLLTLHILDTKVSNLRGQLFEYNDKDAKHKEELKQIIKDQDEKIIIAGVNLELEVKERRGNIDEVSERLNFSKVKLSDHDGRMANFGKHLEQLQNFQHLLTLEFHRIETIVRKEEKEAFEKQIQSLCCQIDDCISKNKERIDVLEVKSEKCNETVFDVLKDIESLKLESESERARTKCVSRKVEYLDAMMKTQNENHIPQHIRAHHDIYISEWKQDTISFVETRATRHILGCLQKSNCIVVTGSSGCGKSSNIHLAALTLHEKFEYEIIPVLTGPTDILNYYNENKRQVFVVDDICGKELINTHTLQMWRDYSKKLEKIFLLNEKFDDTIVNISSAKLLMSCRLHIYKESQFQLVTLFTRKECNLLSNELCLLPEERICLAKKYIPREILEDVKQYMQDVDFFPLLCKLSKDKSFEEVKKLFTDPVKCITQNINHIVNENKFHFCALVLCILFDDGFNTNWLKIKSAPEGIKCKLEGIVKEYDIDLSKEMARNSLKTSFNTLDGTYFKGRGTEFRIIHDFIYKMVAVICGRHLKECFIKYAPSVFIRDHFIFESLTENQAYDDLIVISEDQEEDYFERLLYDLRESVITSTFHNAQLIYQSFMDKLIIFFDGSENAKTCLKDMDSERRTGKGESYKNMNVFKTTPLLESASRGYFSIVHFLIYDLEYCVNNTDEGGRSPLYEASEGGHLKVVRLLLENNAVPRCDDFGDSPLYVACKGGHVDTVELLLQNKVNGDCEGEPDDDNQLFRQMESPLHVACKGGHTHTVQVLLQHDANIDEEDVDGQSPLHVASYYGHTDIVKLLLQNDASVNSKDGDERYPLHIASEEGHSDTVKLLLQYNAHVSDCNCLDESSLDVAFHRRHFETMKVLLKSSDDYSLRCYGQFGNHFSCGQQYTELDKLFNLSSSFGLDLIIDRRLEEEYRQHFQTRTHDLNGKKDVRLYEVPYPFGFDVIIDSRLSVKRSEADFDKQLLNLSVEELIEKLEGHQEFNPGIDYMDFIPGFDYFMDFNSF